MCGLIKILFMLGNGDDVDFLSVLVIFGVTVVSQFEFNLKGFLSFSYEVSDA